MNKRGRRTAPSGLSALAAVCGLVLLVSLFVTWAQVVCAQEPCPYPSGWEVLLYLDIPIAVLALAALALGLVGALRPVTGAALALVGAVAVLLIFIAPFLEDRGAQPLDFGGGWFLGLLAAVGVLGCGLAVFFMLRSSSKEEEEAGEEDQSDDG